ncbi:hypothetical protein KKH19_01440, partial [Patescibacteria group bacterium]|nr:hypothetical protein [Patescibacteria group bacterium]
MNLESKSFSANSSKIWMLVLLLSSNRELKSFLIVLKLKIVLPSLCLLFVVGLVYFFAFAEPAEQLPQNQTFLNLAHSHINASSTSPTNYTSASTQTTQAD